MARQKQHRFTDSETKTNIVQPGKAEFGKIRGRWAPSFFSNDNPVVAEFGCGRGEYTVALARLNPSVNYVGVDIKGFRIWVGAEQAQQEGLTNAAFLRTEIQNTDMHFGEGELSEIWLPFPDPRPKGRDEKRRLTSPRFLEMYKKMLRRDGWLKLKTDNRALFDYTLEVLKTVPHTYLAYTYDLYGDPLLKEHFNIQTNFEQKYLSKGLPIHYLRLRFA